MAAEKKEHREGKEKKQEGAAEGEKKEEAVIDKKKQTLYFIIFAGVIIILFLAIVFVPRYFKQVEFDKNKYNNFQFVQQEDGFWYTMLQKGPQPYWVPFYYHPRELEDIPVETNLRAKFFDIRDNNGSIYITLEPDYNSTAVIAGVEIAKITGQRYGILNVPTHSAFIRFPGNTTVESGATVKTCKDSNSKTMVIWITLSNKNIAYSEGNCLILEAKNYDDMIKVADRLMYHLLGVMN